MKETSNQKYIKEVGAARLVNITNSHSRLVSDQLESTDVHLVKAYTAGDTAVVYTGAPKHSEILLINDKRKIQPEKIGEAKNYFLDKIKDAVYHGDEIKVIELTGLAEISIPKHELNVTLAV